MPATVTVTASHCRRLTVSCSQIADMIVRMTTLVSRTAATQPGPAHPAAAAAPSAEQSATLAAPSGDKNLPATTGAGAQVQETRAAAMTASSTSRPSAWARRVASMTRA
jgi:hypothetical protein